MATEDILQQLMQQMSAPSPAMQAAQAALPIGPIGQAPAGVPLDDPFQVYKVNQTMSPQAKALGNQFDQQLGLGRSAAPVPQISSVDQALGRMGAPAPAAPVAPSGIPATPATPPAAMSRALTGGPASAAAPSTVAPTSLAKTAASVVDDVVVGSADDVVATGLRSRIASIAPGLAGNVSKGSLLKGGAAAITGLMASGWIDQQNLGGENSELDQGLTGGLLGAGAGAGIAMALGGPVGWAALGGAALFAAGNMLLADNSTTADKMDQAIAQSNSTINELIANPMFGVDSQTAQQIQLQVAATTAFYKDAEDFDGLKTYLQGLASTVPSFLMEASTRNAANQQKMALQAQFGPVFSRMVDRSTTAAKQAMDIQMQAASAVQDPGTRAAMESQAANQYSAQMDTMTAYAQQIAGGVQSSNPAAQQVLTDTQGMMTQMMQGG